MTKAEKFERTFGAASGWFSLIIIIGSIFFLGPILWRIIERLG